MRRIAVVIAAALMTVAGTAQAGGTGEQSASPMRSATKARDIGGFTLGMKIRDAAQLAPMKSIGNGGYQTVKDGIRYDFEVTRLGRIFRVDSEQDLGCFAIDTTFLHSLTAKLTAKYGPAHRSSSESFEWSLVEPVKRADDQTLPFRTNWASAYVEGGPEGVTVHVKLLDFRIMWQDEDKLNRAPNETAARNLAF